MYSTSVEGHAVVTLELDAGTDITDKLNEVRTEVDLIDSFPTQAEDPVVVEIKNNEPAMDMVQNRIYLLLKNGIQGIVLVFVVMALFLDIGLAFWVASGIPVTFMGAFLFLEYIGASVNMLSLFGFIMTLYFFPQKVIPTGCFQRLYTPWAPLLTPPRKP